VRPPVQEKLCSAQAGQMRLSEFALAFAEFVAYLLCRALSWIEWLPGMDGCSHLAMFAGFALARWPEDANHPALRQGFDAVCVAVLQKAEAYFDGSCTPPRRMPER
jgi:hypothetical protein